MSIRENLKIVRETVDHKIAALGIRHPVEIIGVTKTMPVSDMKEAISCGVNKIGESKVQEAETKFLELTGIPVERHMIGHLQENKANKAAALFDVVQSVDSIKLAEKLDKKAMELGKILPVMLEVNTSGDVSKYGVHPNQTEELSGRILELKNLKLTGLMTIGPLDKPLQETRKAFQLLYQLRERLYSTYPQSVQLALSMGMSDDFEIAIEEGSNLLRLGRIIFGSRS